jgi:HD-like signal output (HDOD) protein
VLRLLPSGATKVDPVVFWEHSLGCALVCRQFARKISYSNPEKAYLGGLLHDIGIVAHLWLVPEAFLKILESARSRGCAIHEAELEEWGTTHCETGQSVASKWRMPADLVAAVAFHHDVERAPANRDLVAVVALSDLLCRMSGLGYGYKEERQVDFLEEPGFSVLIQECPALATFDWARFTFELEAYMEEVHRLVTQLYRS